MNNREEEVLMAAQDYKEALKELEDANTAVTIANAMYQARLEELRAARDNEERAMHRLMEAVK